MKRSGVVFIVVAAALSLVLSACAAPAASAPSIGDRVLVTQDRFDNLPLTAEAATAQGWQVADQAVPNMGRHALKIVGGKPGPLVLLYNTEGKLIGVELESLTEQPAPPWEHLEEGHPGMEFEHWTIHIYFTDPRGS